MDDSLAYIEKLLKAASPEPWGVKVVSSSHKPRLVLPEGHELALFNRLAPHRTIVHWPVDGEANAKLAALAPELATTLLEMAEALDGAMKVIHGDKDCPEPGSGCIEECVAATAALASLSKLKE